MVAGANIILLSKLIVFNLTPCPSPRRRGEQRIAKIGINDE